MKCGIVAYLLQNEMFVHKIRVKRLYLGVKLKSVQSTFAYSAQGWINH